MPYLATKKAWATGTLGESGGFDFIEKRLAVETLDDAREWVYRLLDSRAHAMNSDEQRVDRWLRIATRDLPESGGIIGRLPDRSVIEVEPTTIVALHQALGLTDYAAAGMSDVEIIIAYNARLGG